MSFRTKILSLYIVLGLAVLSGIALISVITQKQIIQMEKQECLTGEERVQKFLRSQLDGSTAAAVSVTLWDDYCRAVKNKDAAWIEDNLFSLVKSGSAMEFMVVLDPEGKEVAACKAPPQLRDLSGKSLGIYRYLAGDVHYTSDFIRLDRDFYVITLVQTVGTRDKSFSRPVGYTLYGRKVTRQLLNQGALFTGFAIRLADFKGTVLSSRDFKDQPGKRLTAARLKLDQEKKDLLITYRSLLKNQAGRGIGVLTVQMSSSKGTTAIDGFRKGIVFVGIFLALAFVICLIAINRVRSLEKEVEIKGDRERQMKIYSAELEGKVAERTQDLEQANLDLETKNRELVDLQAQIIQQEKLASIGLLAAGVAHEINNPIGFVAGNFNALKKYIHTITGYFSLLKAGEPAGQTASAAYWKQNNMDFILEDMPGLIRESEDGIERVSHIVKNLKDFSRINAQDTADYDLNQGIENTLVIARNSYKYVADVEKDLHDLPIIQANGGEINEVILNIIVNAAQAIEEMKYPEKKLIQIRTYAAADQVCCEIADNGPGIPETIRAKIFDPFFTTKEPGKGTGLGLSISYNIIVNKHHGTIQVASEEGKGTRFTIRLPLTAKIKEPAAS